MRLLFVHTAEKVKKNSKDVFFTDGSYDKNVWDRYLSISNRNVIFYTSLDEKKYSDKIINIKFNNIPTDVKVMTNVNINSSIKNFINIKNRIKRKKELEKLVRESDAIIIRVPCNVDSIVIHFARKYHKPYLLEVVGCAFDSLRYHSWKGKILALYYLLKEKKIIKNSSYVIYVTNLFLQKRYPCKGKSIGCSDVLLNRINQRDLDERIKKIKNCGSKIVLGTCGAIDIKYKGQEKVIQAISKLKRMGYTIEYQLVGNGEKMRLENIAKEYDVEEQIKFLGSISHEKVFNWLKEIDIYIQPSKLEGLPRALIEAMSMACPALGTNIGRNT